MTQENNEEVNTGETLETQGSEVVQDVIPQKENPKKNSLLEKVSNVFFGANLDAKVLQVFFTLVLVFIFLSMLFFAAISDRGGKPFILNSFLKEALLPTCIVIFGVLIFVKVISFISNFISAKSSIFIEKNKTVTQDTSVVHSTSAIVKLFSFKGRSSQKQWWIVKIYSFFATPILALVVFLILTPTSFSDGLSGVASLFLGILLQGPFFLSLQFLSGGFTTGNIASLATGLIVFVYALLDTANTYRRGHDMGENPLVLAIISNLPIPFVAALYSVARLGFSKGIVGDNEYGPDPLVKKVEGVA